MLKVRAKPPGKKRGALNARAKPPGKKKGRGRWQPAGHELFGNMPASYRYRGQSIIAKLKNRVKLKLHKSAWSAEDLKDQPRVPERARKKGSTTERACKLLNVLVTHVYYECQIKKNALQRFKFTLKNNKDFNYEIVINVCYLGNKPVLYVINETLLDKCLFKAPKPIKIINDTAGPNGLVLTLLVFKAMPRINHELPPLPIITKRAQTIKKAIAKLRKAINKKKVTNAINTWNGFNISTVKPNFFAFGIKILIF
ncbi:hypothetical protein GGTG_01686 [Gaeumannomyces tritici R3-111a-1]|uniref:Uncharacterized protein n=1 Tax=Gaeumannomyces tritici (strain R3-111a-1) TaxID=644352 RepID=J3NKA6_GAET3|nr:hypothetical protein GGTG_01686 [Gaeumannomyces tritici R3-111a-1]EJT81710.1 hypothetical protein GGTG_01686 [Gaeumannomyces tritici R3-111a-1]